jgi:hypothetical protein
MKTLMILGFILTTSTSLACPINDEAELTKVKSFNIINWNLNTRASTSTVTLADYNAAFTKVRNIYTPIFLTQGYTLLLEGDWNNAVEEAYSTTKKNNPNRRKVYVSGGFARKPLMTKDTLLSTLCHEIGHHLGGYPKYPNTSWPASSEGQSDYFATAKCLKLVMTDEQVTNEEVANKSAVPEFVKDDCTKQFETKDAQNLCVRLAIVSERMVKTLKHEDLESFFYLGGFDNSTTDIMQYSHPEAQCRLGTLYQGALCNVNPNISFSDTEELTGSCHPKNGHDVGARPLCWFLPKE